jgi:UDP-N-acetyl-D-galactosamine dehydrogenase
MKKEYKIAIIGLGYVGLPLAIAFSKFYNVVGFDIDNERIKNLQNNIDSNFDIEIQHHSNLKYTSLINDIKDSNIYIVTVPTPVTKDNIPDLTLLKSATKMLSTFINKGDIVIYESTVYPGVTEDVCVPIIEKISSLTFNNDFFCAYSPERISPGDEKYSLSNVIKITSGSTPTIAEEVDQLYQKVVKSGTYKAPSIKVAEAAKVIENTQRDVNIALMNELAMMFDKMNIDTTEVLKAAKTKWNFLDFKPGLVGGHCIGVDPYYLSYQSEQVGFKPDLILASRQINNSVADFVVLKTKELLQKAKKTIKGAKVLVLGYTFKENCSDTRNTKVKQIIIGLENLSIKVSVYDPYLLCNSDTNLSKNPLESTAKYDAIIVAVAHNEFKNYTTADFTHVSRGKLVLLDIKGLYKHPTWKL